MRENLVSKLLFIIGIALMVVGLLTGIIIGMFGYRYGLNLANGTMWSVLFTYFFAGFLLGLFFIGLSEIVKLLHHLNAKLSLLEQGQREAKDNRSTHSDVHTNAEKGAETDVDSGLAGTTVVSSEAERRQGLNHYSNPSPDQGATVDSGPSAEMQEIGNYLGPSPETQGLASDSGRSENNQEEQHRENSATDDQMETLLDSNGQLDQTETRRGSDTSDIQAEAAAGNESQKKEVYELSEADKAKITDHYADKEILEIIPSHLEGYGIVKMRGTDGRAFVQIADVRGSTVQEVEDPALKQPIIAWYNRVKNE